MLNYTNDKETKSINFLASILKNISPAHHVKQLIANSQFSSSITLFEGNDRYKNKNNIHFFISHKVKYNI